MNEKELEVSIQEKGLNAPRLSPDMIDSMIISKAFHVFEGTTTTICRIELKNGFSCVGESAAVSLENFDEKIGESIAFNNAREKIWVVAGMLLKNHVAAATNKITF